MLPASGMETKWQSLAAAAGPPAERHKGPACRPGNPAAPRRAANRAR
jgi:hypothetical protein